MEPCFPGHSWCFPFNKVCLHDAQPDWSLSHCGNGVHLKYCECMDCPGLSFKCPGSYCIPVRRLCDETTDCPHGQDKVNCHLRKCPSGMYKCKGIMVCFIVSEACDGVIQCTAIKDDELTWYVLIFVPASLILCIALMDLGTKSHLYLHQHLLPYNGIEISHWSCLNR